MGSFRGMLFFIGQMSVRFLGFWLSSWSNRLTENTLKNMRKKPSVSSVSYFCYVSNCNFQLTICFILSMSLLLHLSSFPIPHGMWLTAAEVDLLLKILSGCQTNGSWFQAVEDKISLLVSSLQLLILLAADHCKALWIKVQYTCRLFTFIFHLKKSIIEMLSFLVSIILICLFYIVNIFLRMSYNSSLYVLI